MAEFCKNYFLKLNPELRAEDLKVCKEDDFCEGCGKYIEKIKLNKYSGKL